MSPRWSGRGDRTFEHRQTRAEDWYKSDRGVNGFGGVGVA